MDIQKLKYSKCPNCKKHGISGFFKAGRYPYTLTCKHCGEKYKMNIALLIIIKISIPIFVGIIAVLFREYIIDIHFLIWAVIALVLYEIAIYFAPLEEVDESFPKYF